MQRKFKEKDPYARLRGEVGDLSAIFGPEWDEIYLTQAGLTLPGWRRPFRPGELRSTFMRLQLLNAIEHDNARLRRERKASWQAQERAENDAEYFRQQLRRESQLGFALCDGGV